MSIALEVEWWGGYALPHVRTQEEWCHTLDTPGWTPKRVHRGQAFLGLFDLSKEDLYRLDEAPHGYLYVCVRSIFQRSHLLVGVASLPFEARNRNAVLLRDGERVSDLLGRLIDCDEVDDLDHPVFYESLPLLRQYQEIVKYWLSQDEERSKARERAKRLLVSSLDDTQRQELAELGAFRVLGQDGQTYVIYAHTHGNVYQEIEKRFVTNFCHVPLLEGLPVYDQMLAQKLLIESDLTTFLSDAIATEITPELLAEQNRRREERHNRFIEQLRDTVSTALGP